MAKNLNANEILSAVNTLDRALTKVTKFEKNNIEFSDRVLDNRIITLEGYLRFLNKEGIPRLKTLVNRKEGEKND
ncbi:MAG TPA: hypothetical protein VJ881_07255 [Halanaerobiales bacterium]|nr:hypothetical protein [Halanaerobiales bacterium]